MARVFISYAHEPIDAQIAGALATRLRAARIPVFLDSDMSIGAPWADEIEREIDACTHFVVLLSECSIRSDMVCEEVRRVHSRQKQKRPRVLPVRVGLDDELPYELGACLNPIHYASWKPGTSHATVCDEMVAAILRGTELSLAPSEPGSRAAVASAGRPAQDAKDDVPSPAAEPRIFVETGTLRPDSPFYVVRDADGILAENLALPGQTFLVKGPRQSGKSSLVARSRARGALQGIRSVYLDFQLLDHEQLSGLDAALRALARGVARDLPGTTSPEELWDPALGAKASFVHFLQEAVLRDAASPVLLCLDEVDRVFEHPYRDDFFALIRHCHNRRATEPLWDRLHLLLSHSTEPSLWIQDLNTSPFNVGIPITLDDFTRAETSDLNLRYGGPLRSDGEVDGLMRLVGGQPFLVRQALYWMKARRLRLDELERIALEENGPFGNHLRRWLWVVYRSENTKAAVVSVLQRGACDREEDFQKLRAAGLVAGDSRQAARLRCDLYARYFRAHL